MSQRGGMQKDLNSDSIRRLRGRVAVWMSGRRDQQSVMSRQGPVYDRG